MAFSDLQLEALDAVLEELGADVTYQPSVGDPATVRGVFFNGYQEAEVGDTVVQSSQPILVVRTSEVADPKQGEHFVVSGTTWRVYAPQPDRKGLVVIELEESPVG